MAGLDASGFTIEALQDLLTDLENSEHDSFGAAFDVSADSPAGQLNGIHAAKLADLWELAQAVYTAQDPDQARGNALDQLLKLTGVTRLPATFSTGSAVLIGTNGTVVPAGTQLSVSGNTASVFATNNAATIATVTAWAASTTYAQGALVTHDTGKLYSATVGGASAGSGGPTGTGSAITDNTVTWKYLATAPAAVACPVTAAVLGPNIAPAGTLTVINTPVGGLSSVTNPLDALAGTNVETDDAARTRRILLLRNEGLATVDAIRAKVLSVASVIQAIVLENTSLTTDGNGTPGKAFLTIVQGGADTDVAQAIFDSKPAGILASGSTMVSVNDSYGTPHTIGFSRPTAVPVYITVSVTVDHTTGAFGGAAAIQQALVNYGNHFTIGESVVRSLLYGQIETVSGIRDVTALTLGTSPSPVGTSNIAITATQLATFDTSRIVVNVT